MTSRIDLLKRLHTMTDELDRPPMAGDFETETLESYESEFGSIRDALLRAGIDPDDDASRKKALLDELRRAYDAIESPKTDYRLVRECEFESWEYVEEFDSLMMAKIEAGLIEFEFPETSESPTAVPDEELIAELWRMSEKYGVEQLSARFMDAYGNYTSTTYQYRYGSWNNALEIAGLPSKDASVDSDPIPKRAKHYSREEWKQTRESALERDDYECSQCGMGNEEHKDRFGHGLHVHHKKDVSEHEDPAKADNLENLETLCNTCHGKHHPFSSEK